MVNQLVAHQVIPMLVRAVLHQVIPVHIHLVIHRASPVLALVVNQLDGQQDNRLCYLAISRQECRVESHLVSHLIYHLTSLLPNLPACLRINLLIAQPISLVDALAVSHMPIQQAFLQRILMDCLYTIICL